LCCAVAGVLVCASRAFAQAPGKVYRIGYLNLRAGPSALDDAFVRGMDELGYTVGHNLVIEYRWARNETDRLQPMADELVRLNVDVIVTATTPAIRAAMRATTRIPIVMAATSDPVAVGLVASLAKPGGNVTGMTLLSTDLARKRLQLMRELVPGATRIGLLAERDTEPGRGTARMLVTETQVAAKQMGVRLVVREIASSDELVDAFAQYRREQAQALIVKVGPLVLEHRMEIMELAARGRLPAMYEVRTFVDDGGFASYGPDLRESYRRAAAFVDRIVKGAKPGDLPVEQPTKFELVINLKTAKTLGLTVAQSLLLRADEVIQ
jgi:putative ABC transport system substrate-binding protein